MCGVSGVSVCVCVCVVRVCVCGGGCPGGLTGKVWAHNPEDTGSDPRTGENFFPSKVPPAAAHPPICEAGELWPYGGVQV